MSAVGDPVVAGKRLGGLPREAKPSLLAVTSELPWPLNTGGHLRTFHLLRALARPYRVRLVTAVPVGQEDSVETLRSQGIEILPAPVASRQCWREGLRAVAARLRREPYVLYRRHDRQTVRHLLRQQAEHERPAVLYLDHLDSFVYRALLPETPAVVDLHNIYSTLARRAASEQRSWLVGRYLLREAALLQQKEAEAARAADAVLAVSPQEASYFQELGARRVAVVPNGVDCEAYADLPSGRPKAPPNLLYVGAMSWAPNVAAVQFLAREVLPHVRALFPEARLQVVGRDPAPEVKELAQCPGVEILGGVPHVIPFLRSARVLVVPLESGGGTRLNILEAFAAGLPVVSTPIGCEGLRVTDGEHLLIAERPRFAERVRALLSDPSLGERLASRARALVRDHYDWSIAGQAACAVIQTICPQPGGKKGAL